MYQAQKFVHFQSGKIMLDPIVKQYQEAYQAAAAHNSSLEQALMALAALKGLEKEGVSEVIDEYLYLEAELRAYEKFIGSLSSAMMMSYATRTDLEELLKRFDAHDAFLRVGFNRATEWGMIEQRITQFIENALNLCNKAVDATIIDKSPPSSPC